MASSVASYSSCNGCNDSIQHARCNAFITIESINDQDEVVSSPLSPHQLDIARRIAVLQRHLQSPVLQLVLPMDEYLSPEARHQIKSTWISNMEMELWNMLYLATSDAFAANEALESFIWKICIVTRNPALAV